MARIIWGPTTDEQAFRRAGGRRRRHAELSKKRAERHSALLAFVTDNYTSIFVNGRVRKNHLTKLGERFGVHPHTISRDFRLLGQQLAILRSGEPQRIAEQLRDARAVLDRAVEQARKDLAELTRQFPPRTEPFVPKSAPTKTTKKKKPDA